MNSPYLASRNHSSRFSRAASGGRAAGACASSATLAMAHRLRTTRALLNDDVCVCMLFMSRRGEVAEFDCHGVGCRLREALDCGGRCRPPAAAPAPVILCFTVKVNYLYR